MSTAAYISDMCGLKELPVYCAHKSYGNEWLAQKQQQAEGWGWDSDTVEGAPHVATG